MSFGLPDVLQHRKALLSITRDRGASSRQHLRSASLPPHLLDMGNQGSDDELEFAGVTVTGWSLPLAFKKGINARDVIPTICDSERCQR